MASARFAHLARTSRQPRVRFADRGWHGRFDQIHLSTLMAIKRPTKEPDVGKLIAYFKAGFAL